MIEDVKGPGIGGGRAPTPPDRPSGPPRPNPAPPPDPVALELRNRLSGIAGSLESLLEKLSQLQERTNAGSEILDRLSSRDPRVRDEIREIAERAGIALPPGGSNEDIGRSVRGAIDASARGREELERSISSAQVALQNILSLETAEPALPPGTPPVEGFSPDRRNILQLLDPA